jgi:tetratricopeptide (TPR) repeat protein
VPQPNPKAAIRSSGIDDFSSIKTVTSDLSDMMGDQKSASQCYLEGNELFKTGNFPVAVEVYSNGIQDMFIGLATSELELQTKLLLNRAQCHLNMREYIGAVEDCSSVISIDSSCIKAYVRRAIAYENLGSFQKGLSDTEFATSLQPSASLLDTIVKLSSRLRTLLRCDAKAIAAEGRPDRMVTDKQVLRLNFLRPIPRTAAVGDAFQARLCIGNEFGLWDRSFLTKNDNELQNNVVIKSDSVDQIMSPSVMNSSKKIRVCVSTIQLGEDQIEESLEKSMFSSLYLDSKEENQVVGDDGKVPASSSIFISMSTVYKNNCHLSSVFL